MVTLVTLAKRLSLRCQTRRLGFLARLPEVVSAVRKRPGMAVYQRFKSRPFAIRMIAPKLRSTSSSVVAQEDTLIRMAV